MNERYLFRGKRMDNGEWATGYYVRAELPDNSGYEHLIIEQSADGGLRKVIPETVTRCTWLKDKNGKLIFEGDVLESRASENKEDWKRWVVVFFDGSFCFEREIPKKRKYKHEQNLLCADNVELYGLAVIGNIHDNKDLLEVQNG